MVLWLNANFFFFLFNFYFEDRCIVCRKERKRSDKLMLQSLRIDLGSLQWLQMCEL